MNIEEHSRQMVIEYDHNMFNFANKVPAAADELPDIELEEPTASEELLLPVATPTLAISEGPSASHHQPGPSRKRARTSSTDRSAGSARFPMVGDVLTLQQGMKEELHKLVQPRTDW